LRAALWQRKPAGEVLVHSDQGRQFSSHDWRDFLTAHRLRPSMNRRGNCHDNAVAESFFQRATKSSGKSRVIQSRTRKNY